MGGLARRASLIKSIRDSVPNVLLLEVGDVFGQKGGDEQNKLYAELSLKSMEIMKYSAMNIGEAEFLFGKSFLKEQLKSITFPVISATIMDKETKKLFTDKPYIISKLGDFKIGILGLCTNKYPPLGMNPENASIDILEPFEVASKYVPELKKKCDIIIVLSHLDYSVSTQLAEKVPGIDIILSGHGGNITFTPVKVNQTIIGQAGSQCKYLGRIDIEVDKKGKIVSSNSLVLPLSSQIKDDPVITELINTYKAKVDNLKSSSVKKTDIKSPAITQNPTSSSVPVLPEKGGFVSNARCAGCHQNQNKQWQTTKHYSAFQTLVNTNQSGDFRCVPCHTTGYGLAGGYQDEAITPELKNVQCEACHGQGRTHTITQSKEYGAIIENTCRNCHTKEWSPDFDFEKYKALVTH